MVRSHEHHLQRFGGDLRMKYADYLAVLGKHIASHPLKLGGGESVLMLLYENYEEL